MAPELLGAVLTVTGPAGVVAVRLTEVEAYAGAADPASHAFRGPTARNAVMFGPPGHLYVYFSYGVHWCANVVCGPAGSAGAVLLRAGRVVEGLGLARERRTTSRTDADLARGPARLTVALGLTGADGGAAITMADAQDGATDPHSGTADPGPGAGARITLTLPRPDDRPASIGHGPRVGISVGRELPYRFVAPGDPTVSAFRPGRRRAADSAP